jgi:ElaB/YqjD/DUF883 family membrane-anchored ribosome-binding protein
LFEEKFMTTQSPEYNNRRQSSNLTEEVKEKTGDLVDQAQHQASKLTHQAQDQIKSAVTDRKSQTVSSLDNMVDAIRSTGQTLRNNQQADAAQYVDQLASQVGRFSSYLDEKEIDQIVGDAEKLARRKPTMFLAGAFGLGLLVGRFLKSSQPAAHEIVPAGYYDEYQVPFEERRSYDSLPRS